MHWVVVALLAWPVVSLVIGVLIGTGIRLERGLDGAPLEPAPGPVPVPAPPETAPARASISA